MTLQATREAAARTFSSLRIRNYRYYFAGQSLSMVGTWMQSVAQSWLAYEFTHSGVAVGLVVALQALPVLLLGPWGGAMADRFGKYRLLFMTQGLAGVQAFIVAALTMSGHLQLWELYAMALSLGVIKMVDNPTRQSFIIEMVGRDHVRNAVTLNTTTNNVARAVGPAVAGLLIAGVGAGWCFLINGISFVFVLSALLAMRQDELEPATPATKARGQVVEGFRYVAQEPVLRASLLMMGIIGCFTYEFQTTLPLMAGGAFHGNAASFGFLTACMGAGSALGGLLFAGMEARDHRRLPALALAFGVAVLIAAVVPPLWAEELALVVVGGTSVAFTSLTNSTLQLEAEPEMRGRVMALWSVAFQGTTPIGGPLVGWIAGELGARYGLGVGAAMAICTGAVYLVAFPRTRTASGAGATLEAAEAVEAVAEAPAALALAPRQPAA